MQSRYPWSMNEGRASPKPTMFELQTLSIVTLNTVK